MADAGSKVLRGLLDVFILESLERAPNHGYALMREMADAFGTEPNRNRIYPLLGRMVRDGLIVERSEGQGTRTLYALTEAGAQVLDGYRALPPAFLDRLHHIWGLPSAATAPTAPTARPSAPAPAATRSVPVSPPRSALPAGELPYPCPDATVSTEKNARTGELAIRLKGCPMGAYDYCPLCPVAQSVDGLRKLTFL